MGRASPKGTLVYKRFRDRGAKWGLVSKPAVPTDSGVGDMGSCLRCRSPQTLQAAQTRHLMLNIVIVALPDGPAASTPSSFETRFLGDVSISKARNTGVFAQDVHVGQPTA